MQLTHNVKSTSATLPPGVTTLSVSWLNNQFKAVAIQRGVVEGAWERTEEMEGAQQFEPLLREAVRQTGYRGTTVSVTLAHPRLSQQLLEAPALRGPAMARFVQAQARQQKLFEGDAAAAHQAAFSGEGAKRLVMHLFPRSVLDQMIQAVQRNDLFLTSVIPATAVLQSQLTQLPMEKNEIAVLAANLGTSTTVVIGRNDGQLFLARTLAGSWKTDAARLAVDLSRTILFVNQQYGVAVDKGVWLFGPEAKEYFPELQRHIQIPVKLSPVEYVPFYWATEALKLPIGQTPNFISLELQKAPQRRVVLKFTTAATLLVVGAAAVGSVWCQLQYRTEQASRASLVIVRNQLGARHLELQSLKQELDRKRESVQRVLDHRPPPVPEWFMAALAEAVPPELLLTNLVVQRGEAAWKLKLEGSLQTTARALAGQEPALVATLQNRLRGAPFHVKFAETATNAAAAPRTPVFSRFASREPQAAPAGPAPVFVLEGVMR
jgi:hypothetical protein